MPVAFFVVLKERGMNDGDYEVTSGGAARRKRDTQIAA